MIELISQRLAAYSASDALAESRRSRKFSRRWRAFVGIREGASHQERCTNPPR
jgi:hypothetical protein